MMPDESKLGWYQIAVNCLWFARLYVGGLGLGDEKVCLVLTILIISFVSFVTVTHKDMPVENEL